MILPPSIMIVWETEMRKKKKTGGNVTTAEEQTQFLFQLLAFLSSLVFVDCFFLCHWSILFLLSLPSYFVCLLFSSLLISSSARIFFSDPKSVRKAEQLIINTSLFSTRMSSNPTITSLLKYRQQSPSVRERTNWNSLEEDFTETGTEWIRLSKMGEIKVRWFESSNILSYVHFNFSSRQFHFGGKGKTERRIFLLLSHFLLFHCFFFRSFFFCSQAVPELLKQLTFVPPIEIRRVRGRRIKMKSKIDFLQFFFELSLCCLRSIVLSSWFQCSVFLTHVFPPFVLSLFLLSSFLVHNRTTGYDVHGNGRATRAGANRLRSVGVFDLVVGRRAGAENRSTGARYV